MKKDFKNTTLKNIKTMTAAAYAAAYWDIDATARMSEYAYYTYAMNYLDRLLRARRGDRIRYRRTAVNYYAMVFDYIGDDIADLELFDDEQAAEKAMSDARRLITRLQLENMIEGWD